LEVKIKELELHQVDYKNLLEKLSTLESELDTLRSFQEGEENSRPSSRESNVSSPKIRNDQKRAKASAQSRDSWHNSDDSDIDDMPTMYMPSIFHVATAMPGTI
jgi:hypothetical protein